MSFEDPHENVEIDTEGRKEVRDGFREWVEAASLLSDSNHAFRTSHKTSGIGHDTWLLEKKVKVLAEMFDNTLDLGDSCCFGTRTVEVGKDFVERLYGGV